MFNAVEVRDNIIQWLQETFAANGNDCNAIIGISGGKDSAVAAALCAKALGRDAVIGVIMPNGVQKDKYDAVELCELLGIRYTEVNIKDAVDGVLSGIDAIYHPDLDGYVEVELSEQTKVNLPARIRMATLYAIAQSNNGRVINTCNLSEDYIGYSTRYGDSVGDFAPLANLTTDEVIAVGTACGLPSKFVNKAPSDGLCGKTDEENLGFTYAVLNRYIRTGECNDAATKAKIDRLHDKNMFKLLPMPTFEYKPE